MKIEKWMWIVGGMVGIVLCFLGWAIGSALIKPVQYNQIPTAALTLLPYATFTPQVENSMVSTAFTTDQPSSQSQIAPGMFVQITGTGGDGLHLRSGPGTEYQSDFVGMESEVFQVDQGPEFADGFTWWLLVAPYDETRKGWAVENYLSIIQ